MQTIPFNIDDDRLVADILHIPAFKPLGKDRLVSVMETVSICDYDRGESIIEQGAKDQALFFLMRGRLSVQVDNIEISTIAERGTVFGEMGAIDRSPRSASVIAKRPSRCLSMEAMFFDRLQGRARLVVQGFFYKMIYETLTLRLRDANQLMADLDLQRMILESMEL